MMVGPKTYIKKFEDKSYEELLEEKTKLNKKIEEFESNESELSGVIISPSPEVVYQCNLEYMAELCNLIAEKFRKRKIQEKSDNNTSVEKCMCGNELKINWESNEKFKMVRCSNCNAEMKFRNPNLIEEKLDDIIDKVVNGDPFWKTTIKKYFDGLTTKNDNDKINFLKKLVKDKDLFNEFTKELVKNENSKNLYEKYVKILNDKQKT